MSDRPSTRSTIFASLLIALAGVASPANAAAQWPPQSFDNLKVLPADIPVRELVDLMAGFTRALGVRCTWCHVGEESMPLDQYDFVSDEKPTKRKARQMLEMVARINNVELAGLESRAEPAVAVRCITCHRGASQPRMLEDVLTRAWDAGGIDSTLALYARLRESNYGSFTYDFGEVPLVDVAGTLVGRGAGPDAIRLLELNVEMNPASAYALNSLGQSLARAGDVDGAIRAFERSLAIDPGNSTATALLRQLRGGFSPVSSR
jgi:tetratricopeptide (TPR) repeat protein